MDATPLIEQLTTIEGIGAKLAQQLIDAGVKSLDDLDTGDYDKMLPTESLMMLAYKPNHENQWNIIDSLVLLMPKYLIAAGSYRRRDPVLKDLDLVSTVPLEQAFQDIVETGEKKNQFRVRGIYAKGEFKTAFVVEFLKRNIRVDLFYTDEEDLAPALMHWTGNKTFNIMCRAAAKRKGMKLNQYGLFLKSTGEKLHTISELDIMTTIGIQYHAPESRTK